MERLFSPLQLGKKRWNAVSEVLRFHCKIVFQDCKQPLLGSSDDQIYSKSLQLLQIGDIKGSVRLLSKHKKNKLAMLLTKCLNQSGGLLQHHLRGLLGQSSLQQGVQRICLHMLNDQDESLPWEQELLRSLLFSSSGKLSLTDHIRQKEDLPNF